MRVVTEVEDYKHGEEDPPNIIRIIRRTRSVTIAVRSNGV